MRIYAGLCGLGPCSGQTSPPPPRSTLDGYFKVGSVGSCVFSRVFTVGPAFFWWVLISTLCGENGRILKGVSKNQRERNRVSSLTISESSHVVFAQVLLLLESRRCLSSIIQIDSAARLRKRSSFYRSRHFCRRAEK